MVDLSICLPAIRVNLWKRLYDSIKESCTRYSFELVFVGPYDLPDELKNIDNVFAIKDSGNPSRVTNIGASYCKGKAISFVVDDGVAFPNAYDVILDQYFAANSDKYVIVCRYREGPDMKGTTQPSEYLTFGHWKREMSSEASKRAGVTPIYTTIPEHYYLTMQPLMSLKYFRELGGLDCCFEYVSGAFLDFSCRMQLDGATLELSPVELINADWLPGEAGDHGPVHHACLDHDFPLFEQMYVNGPQRTKIDYDNWKLSPPVWLRRWPSGVANNDYPFAHHAPHLDMPSRSVSSVASAVGNS
jgi:hypothetical protein